MKLNSKKEILWQKTYGGSGDEDFNDIIETGNGKFLAFGKTTSNDGDVTGNQGGDGDLWVVELNSKGGLISQHTYGGSGDEFAGKILKINNNSYIFSGTTTSNDGDIIGNHGDADAWVVNINKQGEILWQNCIGGSNFDDNYMILKGNDNKLFLAGNSTSNDGDVSVNHGDVDSWVVKLNLQGSILWSRCYGGSNTEFTTGLAMMNDGNIALGSGTNSNDGDVSGNHGGFDIWVPKIKPSNGNILWQKCFGEAQCCPFDSETSYGIMSAKDGGVVVVGAVGSAFDYPTFDAIAEKIDENGNELWKKAFGGSNGEVAFLAVETDEGGLLIQCNTDSDDGDITNLHNPSGDGDAWLVELGKCSGHNPHHEEFKVSSFADETSNTSFINFPNPFTNSITISFSISHAENVSIKIFDITGRLVITLVDAEMQSGIQQLQWDGIDAKGNPVDAGIYFLNINSSTIQETIKVQKI